MAMSDEQPPRWIPFVVCATVVCAAGATGYLGVTLGQVMVANGERFFGWLFMGLSVAVCGGAAAHILHAGWNAIR
ncbi:hypothetical protein BCO37747_07174 [Burkholderia contaminans]|nr:hypothetical protein BLA3211_07547 [Burkholderia aenigmatica]CAB3975951.1 hypothetical protein BCO9919_07303 [Burkholderia cenocepacia]VBB17339.1 hypothetical protein BSTAB16_7554 [Burkholderia stabilis]VWC60683.1 hypothetical protein BLA17378_02269 [Burkholderia aenigmatica]VWD59919.1 hypothetical protein BCO37747_07174 [Burkholderia contaminans]